MNTQFSIAYKIIIATLISLTLFGCIPWEYAYKHSKPSNIYYMNDALNKWRDLKLNECSLQTQIIVIGTFESRINTSGPMTQDEVNEMHNWLMDKCVLHNKLSV